MPAPGNRSTSDSSRRPRTFRQGLAMMAAQRAGIDPELAGDAGDDARLALSLLARAATAGGEDRSKALEAARDELARFDAVAHPRLACALAERLRALRTGAMDDERGGDGDIVAPAWLNTPELLERFKAAQAAKGVDPRRIRRADPETNPATGAQEFFRPWEKVKSWFGGGSLTPSTNLPPNTLPPTATPPLLATEEQRRQSILANSPGTIRVQDEGQSHWKPDLPSNGQSFVHRYGEIIDRVASEEGVDPDLVRTIMFAENARGHKGGLDYLADNMKKSTTVHPMNINHEIWAGLGINKESTYDPETNTRAATRLIGRTWGRLEEPTVAKLTTLYQGLSKDKVTEYGAYGQKAYDTRRWIARPFPYATTPYSAPYRKP